jgi:hypothetical protein
MQKYIEKKSMNWLAKHVSVLTHKKGSEQDHKLSRESVSQG